MFFSVCWISLPRLTAVGSWTTVCCSREILLAVYTVLCSVAHYVFSSVPALQWRVEQQSCVLTGWWTITDCFVLWPGLWWQGVGQQYEILLTVYIVLCLLAHCVFCSMPVLQSCVFYGWWTVTNPALFYDQAYYSGERNNSPVYSLAGNSHHMHVALDMGLFFVDFSIRWGTKPLPALVTISL